MADLAATDDPLPGGDVATRWPWPTPRWTGAWPPLPPPKPKDDEPEPPPPDPEPELAEEVEPDPEWYPYSVSSAGKVRRSINYRLFFVSFHYF